MTNFEAVRRLQAMYPGHSCVVERDDLFEVHGDPALGDDHDVVWVWAIGDDDSLQMVDTLFGRNQLPDWVVGR
jgi:hypothetical protein